MKREIAAEDVEEGRYAFVAVNGGVQIGWGVQVEDEWYVEDMDGQTLAGPFLDRAASEKAGKEALAEAGASNPGW